MISEQKREREENTYAIIHACIFFRSSLQTTNSFFFFYLRIGSFFLLVKHLLYSIICVCVCVYDSAQTDTKSFSSNNFILNLFSFRIICISILSDFLCVVSLFAISHSRFSRGRASTRFLSVSLCVSRSPFLPVHIHFIWCEPQRVRYFILFFVDDHFLFADVLEFQFELIKHRQRDRCAHSECDGKHIHAHRTHAHAHKIETIGRIQVGFEWSRAKSNGKE